MKIQVKVSVPGSNWDAPTLELDVADTDTVASVKERVAILELISFPDQDLLLGCEVLGNAQRLSDCGVQEGTSLELAVAASEATLVSQLRELLQARDLSCDELGLLYCYKHGVSVTQALLTLGCRKEKLQDFVRRHKAFQVNGGSHVALVREDTSLKPFSVADEVEALLRASGGGAMEIKELCAKFVAKFNVSLSSLAGTRPVDYFLSQRERFAVTNKSLLSLRSAETSEEQASEKKTEKPREVPAAAPSTSSGDAVQIPIGSAHAEQYMDLHNKIHGRGYSANLLQTLSQMVEVIQEETYLRVDHVVKGGAIGKGTAILGSTDAEAVFFVKGLPPVNHENWMPPLLRAVASTLSERLIERTGVEHVEASEDSVKVFGAKGLSSLTLFFSPVFGSYAEAVQQTLGQPNSSSPARYKFLAAALAEERVQFIARQPAPVKVTIRLLKWWRDQQPWSTPLTRPSDDVLELMAVYAAAQQTTPAADQSAAVASVMVLLARFEELRIVWSNYYKKTDVWAPLLRHRPLLMDPVNPQVNIADPQAFDARELMSLAQTTHFFW